MKRPKPWFRASKNAWYVEHQFKQHRLGEHPDGYPPPKKTKSGWNAPRPILDAFYLALERAYRDLYVDAQHDQRRHGQLLRHPHP